MACTVISFAMHCCLCPHVDRSEDCLSSMSLMSWHSDKNLKRTKANQRHSGMINHLNGFSYFNPRMAKSQMISCALVFIGRTRAAYKIFIRLYMLLYSLMGKHLKDCYVCKWAEHLSASFKMEVFICSECFWYFFFYSQIISSSTFTKLIFSYISPGRFSNWLHRPFRPDNITPSFSGKASKLLCWSDKLLGMVICKAAAGVSVLTGSTADL